MFDVVIKGGTVVDGTGATPTRADVGIRGDRVEAICNLEGAHAGLTMDATGMVVCPGFIDVHTHAEVQLLRNPHIPEVINQGVTTIVTGQCGLSLVPLTEPKRSQMARLLKGLLGDTTKWQCETVRDFRESLKGNVAPNVAYLVPHGALRAEAMGFGIRPALPSHLLRMRRACRQAMEEGAVGLSTGLTYPPCAGAETHELVELAKEVGRRGGYVAIHRRRDEHDFLTPIREAIEIARSSGAPVHMNHFKTPFQQAGRAAEMLSLVDQARDEGLDFTIEVYPYTMGAGALYHHLPLWVQEGTPEEVIGRLAERSVRDRLRAGLAQANIPEWDAMVVSSVGLAKNKSMEGRTIAELSASARKEPVDFVCDLLVEEELAVTVIRGPGSDAAEKSEDDIRQVLRHEACMVASDGVYTGGASHPRTYATFPRYLGRYARDLGLASLEEAVRKCTALPAERLGLTNRGILRKGVFADVLVFDPASIGDIMDTRTHPIRTQPKGIKHVLVNGVPVLCDGRNTGYLPGRWISPQ